MLRILSALNLLFCIVNLFMFAFGTHAPINLAAGILCGFIMLYCQNADSK